MTVENQTQSHSSSKMKALHPSLQHQHSLRPPPRQVKMMGLSRPCGCSWLSVFSCFHLLDVAKNEILDYSTSIFLKKLFQCILVLFNQLDQFIRKLCHVGQIGTDIFHGTRLNRRSIGALSNFHIYAKWLLFQKKGVLSYGLLPSAHFFKGQ